MHAFLQGVYCSEIIADIICSPRSRKRRQDSQPAYFSCQIPLFPRAQMVYQRVEIVPGDDGNLMDPRIYKIGKDKVHNPVFSAEGNGCQRSDLRQFPEVFPCLNRRK